MQAVTMEAVTDRFKGRTFTTQDVALIREVVATCGGVSRKELANTISELLGWTRPGGGLKEPECVAVLERLAAAGLLTLPEKQQTRPVGSVTSVPHTARGEPGAPLTGRVDAFAPEVLERVEWPDARRLFRELVGRYHDLRYRLPFGAQVQYLVSITQPVPTVVGCLQVSSAAGRVRGPDARISWVDPARARPLPPLGKHNQDLVGPATP